MNLSLIMIKIQKLEQSARDMGFDLALPILAQDVILDERVRMHCQLNLCGNYEKNLMCPPFLPTVAENRILLSNYTFALLLQLQQLFVQPDKESMRQAFNDTARRFGQMAVSLERKAFNDGFPLAMALGAGECKLCADCSIQNGDHNCINPGAARPSMEGMGIDVVKTFTNAGLALDFKTDQLTVAGLLLIN
jgi:predicted metal-binding protein